MLQIVRNRLILPEDAAFTELNSKFCKDQSLQLPGFIGSELMAQISEALRSAKFKKTDHLNSKKEAFAKDFTIDGNHIVAHILHLILNNPVLFTAIQRITNCPEIGSFSGRVYQSIAGSDHHLSWHDDRKETRQIGISINLSDGNYSGGVFQIREKISHKLKNEISNTAPGSAIIFRICSKLEHRITNVVGNHPKTAGAGWFLSESNPLAKIREIASGKRIQ
jgi:hypothetical protein